MIPHNHDDNHSQRVGMAVPLTPLKEFKCTYDDCFNSFDTIDEVKRHKVGTHEFYCKKCDFDGVNWEDSLAHKVEDMVPWLVGKLKDVTPKKFRHIVCEFCGQDFKSLGGRKIHKNNAHQADQQIRCSGKAEIWNAQKNCVETERCPMVFGRASQFIRHIEDGHCLYIKRSQLEKEHQHKMIVKEIMKNPEAFTEGLNGNKLGRTKQGGTENDDADDDEGTEGGVQVGPMDADDASQAASINPLQPERKPVNVMDMEQALGDFPRLSISTNSDAQSAYSTGDTASASTIHSTGPWTAESTKKLFGDAKPTRAIDRNWQAIQAAYERSRAEDERKTNLFSSRFWDPGHSDYDARIFYDEVSKEFLCPFVSSNCNAHFFIESDMASHLRNHHIELKKQCKSCHRIFKNLAGLIQHYEGSARGGKCPIARSQDYISMLHEATGGFLSAKKVTEGKIWGFGDSETEKEDGVRTHDYKAEMPLK